jgi:hypothetical protein
MKIALKAFVSFCPQANCTDLVTAAGRRILVPNFADKGVSPGENSGFPQPFVSGFRPKPLLLLSSSLSLSSRG